MRRARKNPRSRQPPWKHDETYRKSTIVSGMIWFFSKQKYLKLISRLVHWSLLGPLAKIKTYTLKTSQGKHNYLNVPVNASNLNTVPKTCCCITWVRMPRDKRPVSSKRCSFQNTTEITTSYGLWNINISFKPISNKLMEHIDGYQMKTRLQVIN